MQPQEAMEIQNQCRSVNYLEPSPKFWAVGKPLLQPCRTTSLKTVGRQITVLFKGKKKAKKRAMLFAYSEAQILLSYNPEVHPGRNAGQITRCPWGRSKDRICPGL